MIVVINNRTKRNAPTVVSTSPKNGATNVPPGATVLQVTFSKPMLDGSWSWTYRDPKAFPTLAGKPSYSSDKRTVTLPVALAPATTYCIWLNSPSAKNFKDAEGHPLAPYEWTFTTSS